MTGDKRTSRVQAEAGERPVWLTHEQLQRACGRELRMNLSRSVIVSVKGLPFNDC